MNYDITYEHIHHKMRYINIKLKGCHLDVSSSKCKLKTQWYTAIYPFSQ